MAERIGVSQQYYNKFEKGTGQPNLETLYKIRVETKESLDFLVGFYFEDERAKNLYYFYAEARAGREIKEEDVDYTESLMRENSEQIELNMKLLRSYKNELVSIKQKEERALELFFEYISTIPGFEGDIATKKYWIDKYTAYQEEGAVSSDSFWEEFRNL
jgi:transcriptional regulator with XRE-family HTH domain